ncbi:MAG: acetate/propionate family kinase [Actinomycetes bacterium]
MTALVLVINSGSSSLKYQVVEPDTGEVRLKGTIERIGEAQPGLAADHGEALQQVIAAVESPEVDFAPSDLVAVGHRVVHGGPDFSDPVVIDDAVLAEIRDLIPLAPLHNPAAVAGIEAARARLAGVPHVAVFDTAFFTTLPAAAATYAIPADLAAEHRIRRYGFHGTSHHYVSRAAAETLGRDVGRLDQIVLHLGNGCSASAIRGGVAVETSMGLTPLQGLVMGTRSGDVDPGLFTFLHSQLGMSVGDIDTLLNKASGLRGLAGVNDFRELEERRRSGDSPAALAFEVYVHRIKHYLGAYAAILGGVDAISFTAGVGENSPTLRAAALHGLAGFGVRIDHVRNAARRSDARVVSTDDSAVAVLVVPTNEELAIAQQARALAG